MKVGLLVKDFHSYLIYTRMNCNIQNMLEQNNESVRAQGINAHPAQKHIQ